MFIKLDLQWRYNNIWIKEQNEQKIVFTTSEELFEPTVIFFGLTNFPATFQIMINKILQDLINTGKVVSFIDNIIIRMKKEVGYDEMVEKVVKRLVENDLYVKYKNKKYKKYWIGQL